MQIIMPVMLSIIGSVVAVLGLLKIRSIKMKRDQEMWRVISEFQKNYMKEPAKDKTYER